MDDLIRRQAAIDALKVAYWDNDVQAAKDDPCVIDAMTDWAIRQIKALPSAERRGRWEYTKELYRDPNGNHLFYGKICSECNSVSPYDSPYCMNCGANMQQDVTLVGAKMDEKEDPDLPQEAYYNKGLLRWKMKDEVEK